MSDAEIDDSWIDGFESALWETKWSIVESLTPIQGLSYLRWSYTAGVVRFSARDEVAFLVMQGNPHVLYACNSIEDVGLANILANAAATRKSTNLPFAGYKAALPVASHRRQFYREFISGSPFSGCPCGTAATSWVCYIWIRDPCCKCSPANVRYRHMSLCQLLL